MTNITLQKQHRTLWHFIPGSALSAVIIGVVLQGSSIPAVVSAGLSALTFAILLGMVLGNTVYSYIWKSCNGGVLFAKQYLLHLGIILYGFRLVFSQITGAGVSGVIVDMLTLSNTFLLACLLGQRVSGLDKHTSRLIGASSSIRGATAVLATEPIVKAEASRVTVAVVTVVILGIVAIFLYPTIYPLVLQWFSPGAFDIYIDLTMHEVAQVVVVGHATNPDAENIAIISKMLHVMILAPFLILLVVRAKQLSGTNNDEKSKITIPWFAILFIAVAIFNSSHLLLQSVVSILVTLSTFLPAITMAVLNLTTYVSALKRAGAKSLLVALVLFARLIVGGGAINYMI